MRRQDEILLLYPGQAPLARKFLLSQVEGMAGAFDSEELLEFLIGQLNDEDATVRGQALYSLARFLPGYVRKRYAIASVAAGMWTAYDAHGPGALTREGIERAAQAPSVARSALSVTWPLVSVTLTNIPKMEGWNRTRAVLALGRFSVKPALEWLTRSAGGRAPDLASAVSLAQMAREEATSALLNAIREHGKSIPDLYLLLAECPGADAFNVLMDAIPKTTVGGRMNIARALSHFTLDQAATALKELWRLSEGWVGAAALASLEELGHPQAAPVVAHLYRSAPHRFLKLQAVKAAGGLRCEESVAFCKEALRDPDPALCAVALESLVRLGLPREELRSVARPFLASSHVKARTNAILAAIHSDEVISSMTFRELLLSNEALSRLEAAYCLGYLRSKQALELLATLATSDPSPPVRTQAIKSISRYPASEALPYLVPLFTSDEAKVVLSTARVLGRYDADEAGLVAEAVEEALDGKPRPAVRAVLLKTLGLAIRRSKLPHGRNMLAGALSDPEAVVRAGAIEGWVMAGASGNSTVISRLHEIADSPDPKQRCRALLALWNAGETETPLAMARLMAAGGEASGPALDCALEIGLLIGDVALGSGFPELTQRLQELTEGRTREAPELLPYRAAWTGTRANTAEGPEAPAEDGGFPMGAQFTPTVRPTAVPSRPALSTAEVTMPPGDEARATPAGQAHGRVAAHSDVTEPPGRVPAGHSDVTEPPPPTGRFPGRGAAGVPQPTPAGGGVSRVPLGSRDRSKHGAIPAGAGPHSTMRPAGSRPGAQRPRPQTGERQRSSEKAQESLSADKLKEFLSSSKMKRQGTRELQEELERVSYVVGSTAGPMTRLWDVWSRPVGKAVVLSPVALVILLGLWFLFGSGEEELADAPLPAGAKAHLWVHWASGPAKADQQTLKEQDPVKAPTTLVTGPFADLTLDSPMGCRVVMKSESKVLFDGVGQKRSGHAVYRFRDAQGDITFEFEGGAELDVRYGNVRIRSRNVKLSVGKKPERGTITVLDGEARIESPERQATLKAGSRIKIQI